MVMIGVIGYSSSEFEVDNAKNFIYRVYNIVESKYLGDEKVIVPGLTNWKTSRIACSKARDYECFPVDEERIIGNNWGDESDIFFRNY